jgi:hypothetical membrane protein
MMKGGKMKNKVLFLCGILTPVVYIFTVILGGFLWQGYSHVAQPVSDLIATGAPNKPLLDPLFALYNFLTFSFGTGFFLYVRSEQQNRNKWAGIVGALVLIAEGIFGVLTLFFPEPAGGLGGPITDTGMMHIVFAGLTSLTTMIAVLLMGFWFRNSQHLQKYSLYSFLSVATIFLSGGLAAFSISNQMPFGGLFERITMGAWLQWVFVVAWVLYSSKEKQGQASGKSNSGQMRLEVGNHGKE